MPRPMPGRSPRMPTSTASGPRWSPDRTRWRRASSRCRCACPIRARRTRARSTRTSASSGTPIFPRSRRPDRSGSMKITDVTSTVVNAEMRNWIFVKIETDEGFHGWGEATLEWKTRAVVGAIEDLKPLLIGRDPRDIRQNLRALVKHGFWRLGIIGMTAVSGLEHAMWDILGKSVGEPVWRLLGGRVRDKVRIYTHLGLGDMRAVYGRLEAARLAEQAAAVVALGYGAFKVVLAPYTHYTATAEGLATCETAMAALREAAGPATEIMIDFHGRPASAKAALNYIRVLEPFRPMFVEEPLQPGDTEGLAEIHRAARCAIATGERLIGLDEFQPLIAGRV